MLMVVSQDKTQILNFDRIDRLFVLGKMICAKMGGSEKIMEIGDYETYYRAVEELGNIARYIAKAENIGYHIVELRTDDLQPKELLLYQTSEWVSVKNRLPTPYEIVIVYMPGEDELGEVREGYIDDRGKWNVGLYDSYLDVTHWRPMPKPPKEE